MKELTLVYLILTAITCAGCTTTQTISHPSNPRADLELIPQNEKLQLEMIDGTMFAAASVRVEGDSLFLYPEGQNWPSQSVHRSEVGSVLQNRTDPEVTMIVVGLGVAVLVVVGLFTKAVADCTSGTWAECSE